MVALNAQIFAAHVDAGAALEVVAGNTRAIADEAMQQLDGISSRVTRLVDSTVELESRLNDYRELAGMEQRLLDGEAGESRTKLQLLEQELRNALSAIGPLQTELSEAVQQATVLIRFPEAVAATSARSLRFFEQIASQYSDQRDGTQATAHDGVRSLERNYTMAHERLVHEAAVGSLQPGEAISTPATVDPPREQVNDKNEEQLADNVELF